MLKHMCTYTYLCAYSSGSICRDSNCMRYVRATCMWCIDCEISDLWASQVVLMVKNPPANVGDMRSQYDPWVRKISWRRTWQPTAVFLPENPHGQRSLAATAHGVSKTGTWLQGLNMQGQWRQRLLSLLVSDVSPVPWKSAGIDVVVHHLWQQHQQCYQEQLH